MPPLLEDPRIRQTWNQYSHNVESATESAAANIWTFTHSYISPCLSSVSGSFGQCVGQCLPDRDERARRLRDRGRGRGRGRGREAAEYSFDFYDDWEEDEARGGGGLLGWGNDELDRLLSGSGPIVEEQPSGRKRRLSYGTSRKKKTVDGLPDPTIIPSTSVIGFLGRLPWKFGSTLRYKPSAADLQEHPGSAKASLGEDVDTGEGEGLLEEEHGGVEDWVPGHGRKRSSTVASAATTDSFRSRGDLFPSDGEDDAIPLSDEFAMALERRNTGSGTDDRSSGVTRSSKGKRPSISRPSSRTFTSTRQSSMDTRLSMTRARGSSTSAGSQPDLASPHTVGQLTESQLQQEEDRLKSEEDSKIERSREAAARLARERGLSVSRIAEPGVVTEGTAAPETHLATPSTLEEEANIAREITVRTDGPPEAVEIPQTSPKNDFVPARLPAF